MVSEPFLCSWAPHGVPEGSHRGSSCVPCPKSLEPCFLLVETGAERDALEASVGPSVISESILSSSYSCELV